MATNLHRLFQSPFSASPWPILSPSPLPTTSLALLVLRLPVFSPATGLLHVCFSLASTLFPRPSSLENPLVKQWKASHPMSVTTC